MNPTLHTHIKHVVIVLAIVAGVLGIFIIRGKYEAYIADRMAKRDEQIAANQQKVVDAQKTIKTATNANIVIDAQRDRQIASLQLASKPDSAQIRAIVEGILPGVRTIQAVDAQGNPVLAVADTQANRDAINRAQVEFKSCKFELNDCQQKQANYLTIIKAKDDQIEADTSTIKLQDKNIVELRKFQVPRWTLMAGAGKAQGTSFQQAQSYQPVIGIDYRVTQRFGIFGLAQNKSAAIGLSWRFGGTLK